MFRPKSYAVINHSATLDTCRRADDHTDTVVYDHAGFDLCGRVNIHRKQHAVEVVKQIRQGIDFPVIEKVGKSVEGQTVEGSVEEDQLKHILRCRIQTQIRPEILPDGVYKMTHPTSIKTPPNQILVPE